MMMVDNDVAANGTAYDDDDDSNDEAVFANDASYDDYGHDLLMMMLCVWA